MTLDMRPRLPHLHKEITRHGKTVWYVRLRGGSRSRAFDLASLPQGRGTGGKRVRHSRPVRQFKLDSSIVRPGFLGKTPPRQRLRYLRFVGGFAD
jgi:hypothetical protein